MSTGSVRSKIRIVLGLEMVFGSNDNYFKALRFTFFTLNIRSRTYCCNSFIPIPNFFVDFIKDKNKKVVFGQFNSKNWNGSETKYLLQYFESETLKKLFFGSLLRKTMKENNMLLYNLDLILSHK